MLAKVSQVPFNYLPNLKLGYHKDLSTKSTSNLSNSNFFMFIEKKIQSNKLQRCHMAPTFIFNSIRKLTHRTHDYL